MARVKHGRCELCERTLSLTFHHLIPKKMHRRPFFRKTYSNEQLNAGINICRKCHTGLHKLYDEITLAKKFNSIDALRSDEAVRRHSQWVSKQKS